MNAKFLFIAYIFLCLFSHQIKLLWNFQLSKHLFLSFNREQWAELRKSVPLKLTEQDLKPLLGFNEDLSLDEVSTIYLPLTRLINYYIDENLHRQTVLHRF